MKCTRCNMDNEVRLWGVGSSGWVCTECLGALTREAGPTAAPVATGAVVEEEPNVPEGETNLRVWLGSLLRRVVDLEERLELAESRARMHAAQPHGGGKAKS